MCDAQVLKTLLNLLFQIEIQVARDTSRDASDAHSPFFCALDNAVCSLIHFGCVREETRGVMLGAIKRDHFMSLLQTLTPPRSQCVAVLVSLDVKFRTLFLEYLSSASSPFRSGGGGEEMEVDEGEEEEEEEMEVGEGKGLEGKVGDGVFVSQMLLLPILICAYGGEKKGEKRGEKEEELLSSILEFLFSCGGLFVPPSAFSLSSPSSFEQHHRSLYHSFGGGAFLSFHNLSFQSSLLYKKVQSRALSSSPALLSSPPLSSTPPPLLPQHPPLDFLSYYLSSYLLPAIEALSPSLFSCPGVTLPKRTAKNLLKFFENQAQSLPLSPSHSPPLPSYFLSLYSHLLFTLSPPPSSSSSSPLLPPKNKKRGTVGVASSKHLLSFFSFCLKMCDHQVTSLHDGVTSPIVSGGGVIETMKKCLQMVVEVEGTGKGKKGAVGKVVGRLVEGGEGAVGLGEVVKKLVGGGKGVERECLVGLCEFFEVLFEVMDGGSSCLSSSSLSGSSKKRKVSKGEKDKGMQKKKTTLCSSLSRTLLSPSTLSLYFPSLSDQKEAKTQQDTHTPQQEALLSLLGFLLSHCPPPPLPPSLPPTTVATTTATTIAPKPFFAEPQTDDVFTQESFVSLCSLLGGSVSGCDAVLLGLLFLFEVRGFTVARCGGGMGGVLSFASSSSSSSSSSISSSLAPSGNLLVTMLFQSSIDQHKLYDSLRHFPVSFTSHTHAHISSPSQPIPTYPCDRFISSSSPSSSSSCCIRCPHFHYSPLFLLPLFEYAVSVDKQLDCSLFVTQNGLGYCVVATSSDSPQIRELAYSALSRLVLSNI